MPPEQGIHGGCHNRPTLGSTGSASRRHQSPIDVIVIVDGSDIEETHLLNQLERQPTPPPRPSPLTQSIIHLKKEANEKRSTSKTEETTSSNLQDRTQVVLKMSVCTPLVSPPVLRLSFRKRSQFLGERLPDDLLHYLTVPLPTIAEKIPN
ncbi:hypothetical protein SISNIDRAFT_483776 [Sistotremastrum niveocremeum HHB9708]|uniref:Uncharacterized protein n=1 Tax=Sistotremastrum niveocremeum HHB9708 TaxID=1314777 RepID=A0A164X149_9AGAM|nr:hypothetical protein SISNIDRAFT_483776 [Sistotremastrum niveocremeum HHB9708]